MAPLPDPAPSLTGDDLAAYEHVAATRGMDGPPEVYRRLFNNPDIATLVGAVGERLRYRGIVPGDVRELVILRTARRMGIAYEWAHHVGPALAAGLDEAAIAALARQAVPEGLRPDQRAALTIADVVYEFGPIPAEAQAELGDAAAVEVVALVGHYRLLGGVIAGFEIELDAGHAPPAWAGDGAGQG